MLDLPKHMAEHIYMYAGENVLAMLNAKEYLFGDIMDWFGCNVKAALWLTIQLGWLLRLTENAMFIWYCNTA